MQKLNEGQNSYYPVPIKTLSPTDKKKIKQHRTRIGVLLLMEMDQFGGCLQYGHEVKSERGAVESQSHLSRLQTQGPTGHS